MLRSRAQRASTERGSVLMLVPAGVLVLFVLAAIAFDFAHLHLGRRELLAVAEAAANDAVTYGIDPDAVRETGDYVLVAERVRVAAERSIEVHQDDVRITDWAIEPTGPDAVRITITGVVDYVFARAVPGAPTEETVTVTATARAVAG